MRLRRSHLQILAACLAFGLMPVFTRSSGAPVLAMAAYRAVFVAAAFALAAVAQGGGIAALRVDRGSLRLASLYGLALALASSTFVGGYALTTVANAVFLHSLAPLFAFPLAARLFAERPRAEAIAGSVLAVIGVGLLSGASVFGVSRYSDPRFLAGDLLALASAAGYGAVLVATRATRLRGLPILTVLAIAWAVAAVFLLALAAVAGQAAIPARSIPWVLALALVSTNLPFYLLNLGMRQVAAGPAALLSMSEVVFATAVGLAVYGEKLAPVGWLGGALVVLGILYPFSAAAEEDPTPGDGARGAEPHALSPGTLARRWGRIGLRLVGFNAGAGLVLLAGDPAGAVLAWASLVGLLRLGRGPAAILLDGRFPRALRAATGLAAIGAVAGLISAPGTGAGAGLVAVLFAGVLLIGDRLLRSGESEDERDEDPLGTAALGLVAVGALLHALGHAAAPFLLVAATGSALLGALGVLAAAVSPDPRGAARPPGWILPIEAIPGRLGRPGVLGPVLVALVLAGGVRVVPAGHRAVVERFGAPTGRLMTPGLLVRLPPPVERVLIVDVASVRQLPFTSETPVLSADQAMVAVDAVLDWKVKDPVPFALRIREPEQALAAVARAALVETVSRHVHEAMLTTGRTAVEGAVAAATQTGADRAGLGVSVLGVHMRRVAVPAPVTAAFLDVISAEEEKRTVINVAESYAARVVPEARGKARHRIEGAFGEAASLRARALGRAALLRAERGGGEASVPLARTRLWIDRVTDLLAGRKLVIAPRGVRVWLGAEGARVPAPLPPVGTVQGTGRSQGG